MTDNKLIDKLENNNIPVFNVSEITKEITNLLEDKYSYVKIKGEISGETGNKYPEIYFTLKDDENVISAIIKRNKIPNLKLFPKDGLEVICTGKITAYTKRDSKFQIDVDSIAVLGEGQLLKLKEELRKKLEIEGLFDIKHKKEIPFIPNRIGIITSPSGSVIKDMQRIIFERFSVPIELYPVTVQGGKAVKDIMGAIKYFNDQLNSMKTDVLIIARGGGSIEDLWCFNNEDLVRSVFNSKIPIISAIGHEPDINIIDYVADISLATPSHAAKKVVPERGELLLRVKNIFKSFENSYSHFFTNKIKNLDYYFSKLQKPDVLFNFKKESFFKNKVKFFNSEKKFFQLLNDKLKNIVGKFDIGSHQNILKRGYAYIKNLKDNSFIKSAKNIEEKTNLTITFHDGSIEAISKKNKNFLKNFFLVLFIFFCTLQVSLAKVFSNLLELNGSFTQGGLLFGKTSPTNKVFFNNKKIFVNESGDFVLGIGRDEKLENSIIIQGLEKKETHKIKISKRKYKIQRIEGLPKNKVTPNKEELKRIKKESKKISSSKSKFLNKTLYKSGFIWPVKGIITGEYGNQRILNGQPRRPHYGLDISAVSGTKVISPSDAEVSLIMEDTFFNGKMIILNHGLGLNSIYSHLKKIHVKEREKIKKGDLIAEVGNTGRSTGPHLDWRINVFNIAIDPELLLSNQPKF